MLIRPDARNKTKYVFIETRTRLTSSMSFSLSKCRWMHLRRNKNEAECGRALRKCNARRRINSKFQLEFGNRKWFNTHTHTCAYAERKKKEQKESKQMQSNQRNESIVYCVLRLLLYCYWRQWNIPLEYKRSWMSCNMTIWFEIIFFVYIYYYISFEVLG